uniref:Type ISP restriction-modification enzyme LLaBIII C-terminal specificity domain-containing protein n=1 Tax=Candidatus Kentrum sp. UNK TaxID=2126344 RepID=A0A451A4Q9_9GAMM|nr:MAG: hypothetical protein BECKUNK1418G_GA0071005_10153 [Candidatus Kentron sp. UNK]VFK69607.1 MAG: hypothetical protein BECKUNK1418H_GA0071006_101635 [Candidatus Kentron sp. UNK]
MCVCYIIPRFIAILDANVIDTGQRFPFYLYDEKGYRRFDAITDAGLAHFRNHYPDRMFTKQDLFYYCYGLLHSPDYRARFTANLAKQLPRIPAVSTAAGFWEFSQAGRALADLQLDYETIQPYPATLESSATAPEHYRVEKMKYGKRKENGKAVKDRATIHYNHRITVSDIPLGAYEYVVNGKSAIDWVMERQCVKIDKASGIRNDANDWAVETMGNPKYPLELLLRIITVSLKTMEIVDNLPRLDMQ